MTRYEPYCDCSGGHVTMLPDPNGQWRRVDGQQPVADDPSGIVQQMPEGDLAELRASITPGQWRSMNMPGDWGLAGAAVVTADPHDPYMPLCSCEYVTPYCLGSSKDERDAARRANANARAIALLPDLLDEVITRRATEADLRAEVERLRAALIKINVGNGWAALIARAALFPKTDGGQYD